MLQELLARGLLELSNKCFMLGEFCCSHRHYSIMASLGSGVLIASLSGTLGLSFQCIVKLPPLPILWDSNNKRHFSKLAATASMKVCFHTITQDN